MERGHITLLRNYLAVLNSASITKILDAGSGKTSLSAIIDYFPTAEIDAVVYPGDERKLKSIDALVSMHKTLHPIELDLCTSTIKNDYDLVVAHLLLGEATKFGNSFETLLRRLLSVHSKKFIIIDYLEDPNVDPAMIESVCKEYHLKVTHYDCIANENPQVWDNFTGTHNFGYLITF